MNKKCYSALCSFQKPAIYPPPREGEYGEGEWWEGEEEGEEEGEGRRGRTRKEKAGGKRRIKETQARHGDSH